MKARIVAIVVAASLAIGLFGVYLLAFAYNTAIASPPDDSGPVTGWTPTPAPAPTEASATVPVATELPLPTEADIPASFTADERADALDWLAWAAIIDQCMSDAGFDEYRYTAFWQPGFTLPSEPEHHSDEYNLALDGSTGGGADYHWEDAGCAGAATHELGFTS